METFGHRRRVTNGVGRPATAPLPGAGRAPHGHATRYDRGHDHLGVHPRFPGLARGRRHCPRGIPGTVGAGGGAPARRARHRRVHRRPRDPRLRRQHGRRGALRHGRRPRGSGPPVAQSDHEPCDRRRTAAVGRRDPRDHRGGGEQPRARLFGHPARNRPPAAALFESRLRPQRALRRLRGLPHPHGARRPRRDRGGHGARGRAQPAGPSGTAGNRRRAAGARGQGWSQFGERHPLRDGPRGRRPRTHRADAPMGGRGRGADVRGAARADGRG